MERWIDQELAGCSFADERLGRRFGMLMEQLSQGIGRTIPLACGDWAATKAAYRFLDNDRVNEVDILAGHFQAADASRAINSHINSPSVQIIKGTYRGQDVIHYLDPKTGLNVVSDPAGNFIDGWKLGTDQLKSVTTSGRLY